MLRSMLCLGRDENGHPTDGIDIVPERPKLSTLMTLLQEANQRADKKNTKVLIIGIERIIDSTKPI